MAFENGTDGFTKPPQEPYDSFLAEIKGLANQMNALHLRAVRTHGPEVERLTITGQHIRAIFNTSRSSRKQPRQGLYNPSPPFQRGERIPKIAPISAGGLAATPSKKLAVPTCTPTLIIIRSILPIPLGSSLFGILSPGAIPGWT